MDKTVTSKGIAWELSHSIWMIWSFFPTGFFNYISFFYIGYRTKQKKWHIVGFVYLALFIFFVFSMQVFPSEHWMTDIGVAGILLSWILSVFHVFKVRTEYLLRLEAILKINKKGVKDLENRIRQEYFSSDTTLDSLEKTLQNEDSQEYSKTEKTDRPEFLSPVNINTADEGTIATIPSIGGIVAKKIIMVREAEGEFKSLNDFVVKMNFKPHVIEKIKDYIIVSVTEAPVENGEQKGRIIDF